MIYKTKKDLISSIVRSGDKVLDVGFVGQGIREDDPYWPHRLLKEAGADVWGIDLELPAHYAHNAQYQAASAEQFSFANRFDVIFAGDLIEHLSNPGLFLQRCRAQLGEGGRLVLTTPNTFNLFNIAEKFTKDEPTVNPDHVMYLTRKTLTVLLRKNGFKVTQCSGLYTLGYRHRESWRKKVLNALYWLASCVTEKFVETLVVVAEPI